MQLTVTIIEYDDWEWGYINGKIFAEGHSVEVEEVLQAISEGFQHFWETVESFAWKTVYIGDHLDDEEVEGYCWNANSLSDWPEEVQEAARQSA